MPKPTTYPDWDLNNTNTTALVAGHVSDGFANDEIPTAAEFNEWMRRTGLWVRFFDAGDLGITGLTLPSTDVPLTNAGQIVTPASGTLITRLIGGGSSAAIQGLTPPTDDGRVAVLLNTTGGDVSLIAQDFSDPPIGYQLYINDASSMAALRLPKNAAVAFRYDLPNATWQTLWSSCPLVPAISVAELPLMPAARLSNCGWTTNTENIGSTSTLWEFDSVSHGAWGLKVGDRIKLVSITMPTTSAGTYTVNLCKRDAAGVGSVVQGFSTSGAGGNIATSWAVTSPTAIQVGERWFVQVLGPNNGDVLTDIHVQFDHPL